MALWSWLKGPVGTKTSMPASDPLSGVRWLSASESPFGVDLLDCRSLTQSMLAATQGPRVAESYAALRGPAGAQHRGRAPAPAGRWTIRRRRMSIWKRWFARRARPSGTNPRSVASPIRDTAGQATCPYCGGGAAERSSHAAANPTWKSECGAIGSGSPMYPDLDEVADGLLAILHIPGSVSEPSIPTGSSGVPSMQHYDIPKSLDRLREILSAHDIEMQTNTWNESGHAIHAIWVRRRIAQPAHTLDGLRPPLIGIAIG